MKSHSFMCLWRALAVLLLTLPAFRSAEAASGFTMYFLTPESNVSAYQEDAADPSVSIGYPVYPRISFQLKRRPDLIASSFDSSSFRFNTVYFRRGQATYSLVPVSVDAKTYNAFRREYLRDQAFDQMAIGTLKEGQAGRTAGGLGLSVDLPKRLENIFGEGGAGLRVSGYRKIVFSGRSQWTDAAESPIYTQSKFPSLNMEQIYQFDITGTIGSKITVKVSQDSHTDIPLANRIQIRYKGDDDDVLKTVEAGNTNLSLPNTQFVGYSSQIRGLFGVKAEAQLGSLYLTAIASQEKGSSERTTITPTGEESARAVRDHEYAERKIFDLGDSTDFNVGDSVVTLFVFQEVQSNTAEPVAGKVYANLLVDPDQPDQYRTENRVLSSGEEGVVLMDPQEYIHYSDPVKNRHFVVFSSRLRDYSVGVWMVVRRGSGAAATYDTIGVDTEGQAGAPWILKLIYAKNAQPSFRSWNYMWRNIYDVPINTEPEDLDVKVYKGLAGSENTSSAVEFQTDAGNATQTYLEVLGLDKYTKNNLANFAPDGRIDAEDAAIYRKDWGVIIFPSRTPFADTVITFRNGATQPLAEPVPQIYAYESPTQKTAESKYFMKFFTKTRSAEIRLGRPNIIEGSERVTANGAVLTKGTDYRIDYDLGRITLLSGTATDPNADIGVEFEYAPFLAVQKKTLLGFRSEYEFSRNFKIGSTVLYKSDKAQDRKPRVGQETAKSFVFDIDASLQLQPNFLTRLADALPIVKTESPSTLRLSGEVAQSRPNPNVEGVAYIDDFEASTEQTSLGTARTQWQLSSKPYQLDDDWKRSKLIWFNDPDSVLKVTQVYDRESKAGESIINSLKFIFRPNWLDTTWAWVQDSLSGNPEDTIPVPTIDTIPAGQANSWGGVMRYFRSRIDAERVQLFEVRARANSGRMHLEFGRISEDVNGDGNAVAFSEDGIPYNQFDPYEDVGFDGLPDSLEPFYHPVYNPDPNHDDWWYNNSDVQDPPSPCPFGPGNCRDVPVSMRWDFVNGSEGNRVDGEFGPFPDQEKLSSTFEQQNGYFSYVIDFGAGDSPFKVKETEFQSTDGRPGDPKPSWFTYRIPIRDSLLVDQVVVENTGDTILIPRWTGERISHIRIWFESEPGQTSPDTVEIADWYFVQTSWRDTLEYGPMSPQKAQLVVASISEDDRTFKPPPGVTAYKDPSTNVTESQRGLMIRFDSLDYRDFAQARKQTLSVDKYAGYRSLEMYVYGKIDTSDIGRVMFYLRIGRDSVNYYEQRRPLYPDWNEANYIKFDFNEITAFKDAAERDRDRLTWKDIDTISADRSLRVRGDPNLNEVKYFAAGVMNIDSTGINPVSGEVWLDELRVTDVRRDVGTAARFSASGNIADLGTYNFTYQSQDPYFRGLSSSTRGGSDQNLGSGQTDTRLQYSMSLNVDKFLPRSWNARLPVQFSYARSVQTPLLRTGSDIVLPEEIRKSERSISESRTFSVSPSFDRPGKNPLFNLLLNRLEGTSVSYRRSVTQSPRTPYSFSEGVNVRSGYNFGIKSKPTLPILFFTKWVPILDRLADTKLGLYPSNWRVTGGFDRSLTVTDDVSGNRRSSFSRTVDGRMDVTYDLFQNLQITMRFDTRSDLSDAKDVNFSLRHLKLGLQTHYGQSFTTKYTPNLLSWLSTEWTYSATYSDDWDRSSKSTRSSFNKSWGVGGSFDHIRLLGGKSSGGNGERRFRGGRGRGRRDNQADQKPSSGRPFYDPPLAVLRFLTGWISSPRYSYSETFKYALPGMIRRPGWNYRLGFTRDPGVALVSSSYNPDAGEGAAFDVSSSFNLLGGIATDVKYRRTISTDLIKRGNLYETINTSWPDLTIRIQRFQKLPLLKPILNKFIDVFSPRTAFTRSTRKTTDLVGLFTTTESENISQNPLLSLNFKIFRSLSLSTSVARNKENSTDYSRTSGALQSKSSTVRNSYGGTAQYSFTAPGGIHIPLFGRMKFRSTVNFSLDIKYNKSLTENEDADGRVVSSTTRSELTIRPDISYTFSQQISGGLSMRWSDTDTSNRVTHLREVQIWMEIRF